MPELPDVEAFRKYMEEFVLEKKVTSVSLHYAGILKDVTWKVFKSVVTGSKIIGTDRHGKYLFAKLNNGNWLRFHFGMTGRLQYYDGEDEKPRHTRISFTIDDGSKLAFINQRKLGHVGLVDEPAAFIDTKKLGPDAMDLAIADVENLISIEDRQIKTVLMDQSLLSGIGNVYSDEILFHSEIKPNRKVKDLSEDDIKKVAEKTHSVLKTAIQSVEKDLENQKEAEEIFPKDFLLLRRKRGKKCPYDGKTIQKIKVGGRPTYFCPAHQK